VQDAAVAAREGDRSGLEAMVMSVDAAVPELPIVVVRDSAVDALCHGASLAGVGVISCMEFVKDQTVAVLTERKEFVCLGQALVPSASFKPGETGLVVTPTTVFMAPGTYPRGWTKSDKVFPEKKKSVKTGKKPAILSAGRRERRPGRKPYGNADRKQDARGRTKGYH